MNELRLCRDDKKHRETYISVVNIINHLLNVVIRKREGKCVLPQTGKTMCDKNKYKKHTGEKFNECDCRSVEHI